MRGAARICERLNELGGDSDAPGGLTRLTLSPAHKRAVERVAGWMREADLATSLDGAGTLVGRRQGAGADAPTLIIGSHIDSVRDGGLYDGPLGVLLGLEACALLKEKGQSPPFAIEVAAFGDEEGVRFATSLTGSRALAGTFDPASLDTADAEGITRREALVAFGCDPATIPQAARDPARTLGYVEFHIEQGPVLEAEGLPLGLVTAINGATRGEILVEGAAGHAGTLPMAMRRDAAAAAAEIVLAVERIGRSRADLVATVGRIEIPNGAVNVVPGRARLSLDVRSPRDDDRAAAVDDIRAAMATIAQARGVSARLETSYDMPAAPCDEGLTAALARSLARCGHRDFRLPSGAGHDAMSFRGRIPMAMVFVRCRGGSSHRPDEHASQADIAAALAVLEDFIGSMGARS